MDNMKNRFDRTILEKKQKAKDAALITLTVVAAAALAVAHSRGQMLKQLTTVPKI